MPAQTKFSFVALFVLGVFALQPLFAQVELPAPPQKSESKTISTIRALRTSITSVEESLKTAKEKISSASTDTDKEDLTLKIAELEETLARLNREMQKVITGIDIENFRQPESAQFDVSEEFRDLLRPILTELKSVTAKPRELEDLRSAIGAQEKRLELAEKAVGQINELIAETEDEMLEADLNARLKIWEESRSQTASELAVARLRLEDAEASSSSIFGTFTSSVTNFARTRGRNLLLALVVGLSVFLLLRVIHRFIHQLSPFKRRGNRSFGIRLIDVAYYLFNIFAAVVAALLTLYVAADWIMLGIFILVIVGVLWTGKNTLPLVYEQAKLMLNLGAVREGERIVYNGIPWEVRSINIYTDLVNHELEGGEIRLPLKSLVSIHSRPFKPQELFFPCKKGEWTILPDGRRGKIVAQTPDWVQMIHLGGSRTTFATSEFVTLQPQNLSTNFRVKETFGVDYQHQSISTSEIPEKFKLRLTNDIAEIVGKENLLNLSVDFKTAGASSLDYAILADFSGEVAASYERLHRIIQRICVDTCNENGWVIPFTQITIHNAA